MNNELYVTLTENSPFASFIFDLDKAVFLYTNPAFRRIAQITGDEVNADFILRMIPPEDKVYLINSFNQLLDEGGEKEVELRLVSKSDEIRWLRLAVVISPQEPRLIIGNVTDITNRVANLNTFKKYANKKNSILTILAHDLLGPLGAAQAAASILASKAAEQKAARLAETIVRVNKQAINLIRDLTDREFMETAEVVLVKTRVNIALKLKEVIEEYQKSEELTKRTFNFYSSSETVFLDIDESKFMQIINNLFSNALKFTENNGVISLQITENVNSVLFSVADNGIGIPEEHHDTLFEKFTPARRKGLHGEPTVGLGLSIVKTIVEWHNGKIWFESRVNEGTTMYFEIPKN